MDWSSRFRPALEGVIAFFGLALCLPLLAGAAVAILVDDGWPVLFPQDRVGRNHRLFRLWKLRSMRKQLGPGTQITSSGDPRVTRIGRFLRKYKLDEVPQLWNVCRGEMSLVGPRPEVPAYVDCGDPTWDRVLSVRPGMTDLSTLVFRNEEEVLARSADPETFYRTVLLPEKLRLALRYHQARSVLSDVRLLTATIRLSLQPSNSDADSIKKKFLN